MIRAHQPGSEPIDIPETIPNPVVVPKPTPTPTEPAPKEPVRIPEKCSLGRRLNGRHLYAWRAVRQRRRGAARPSSRHCAQPFVLSAGDGEFEYRIKSMNEPHERVVRESELQGRVVRLPLRTCCNFAPA